jgi:hypothetical protein
LFLERDYPRCLKTGISLLPQAACDDLFQIMLLSAQTLGSDEVVEQIGEMSLLVSEPFP